MEEKKVYNEEEIQRILDSAKVCTKTNICKGCKHSSHAGESLDEMECFDRLMEELYDVAALEHKERLEYQAAFHGLGNDFAKEIKEANDQIKTAKIYEKHLINAANRDDAYIKELEDKVEELESKIDNLEEANHWLKHKGVKSDDSDNRSKTIDDIPLEDVVDSIIGLYLQLVDSKRISECALTEYLKAVFNDRCRKHFMEELNDLDFTKFTFE